MKTEFWRPKHPAKACATPCKVIQDSLGFGFHAVDSGFQAPVFLGSLSVERGFWITVVSGIPDSRFLNSNLPGFRVPQAKISRIMESGLPYMGRIETYN